MTGYGDASEQVGGVQYTAEVRSLNNRFFKVSYHLDEALAGLEAELDALLRQRLVRGSITVTVHARDVGQAPAAVINDAALLAYLDHLEKLHERFAARQRAVQIDLTALLALPGVLQQADPQQTLRAARPVVARLTEAACAKLLAMRLTEGRGIGADLARQRQVIRDRLAAVAARAPQVIEEYHQRLRTRIDDLIRRAELTLDQHDLVREVAIFAERSDISEELSRLGGHLAQFEELVADGNKQPAGRTLEFLAQEMLREANTIGSKSADALVSRAIVDIKGAIDRIKEQVQNVE
jgi:uncharacterized protein (TIGR00255 family)